MQHKYYFKALNLTLNNIRGTTNNCSFGNIPIVLGGDFVQILPVFRKGNCGAIVEACLQQSFLWSRSIILSLFENMRVREGEANRKSANWLRQMSF